MNRPIRKLVLCTVGVVFPLGAFGFDGPDFAASGDSYMVRLTNSAGPAALGNDGNTGTTASGNSGTVEGYWEVDLGSVKAVDSVQVLTPSTGMGVAVLRLFDGDHASVYSAPLSSFGSGPNFDAALGDYYRVRYIRVGLEGKRRNPAIQITELRAFGAETNAVGLLSFGADTTAVAPGGAVTLSWDVASVLDVAIYPGVGDVSGQTLGDGTGSIVVNPDESTEYRMVITHTTGVETKAVSVQVAGEPLPVRINEVLASNRWGLEDGYNDLSDWIELHNPSGQAVDLTGFGLSDDPVRPMKWVFPAVQLPANGLLTVFASGRDEAADSEGFAHTNFKVDAAGETLVLTAPGGAELDRVELPGQRPDLSYGRTLEGVWAFLDPTPQAANIADDYVGWLPDPVFSHERGFYTNAVSLVITNADTVATLNSSVDGSHPTLPYAGPISVSDTVVVRAVAERPGYKPSAVITHSFLFLDLVPGGPKMNQGIAADPQYAARLRDSLEQIPSMSIAVGDQVAAEAYNEQPASVEVFFPKEGRRAQVNAGFVRYGGAYTLFAKKNYRLKFRRDYGPPKWEEPLFTGFERGTNLAKSVDEIDLRGGGHDMNQRGFYMSSAFVEDSMLDMESLNPHGRYMHLYLNGEYWGVFHVHERMIADFLAGTLGGKTSDYFNIRGNDNAGSNFVLGTPAPVNRASWDRILGHLGDYQAQKAYVDVSNLIDTWLLWHYGNCESEYRAASSVEAGSGAKFWLADPDGFLRSSSRSTTNPGPAGLLGALITEGDPDFMTLLADRIYMHLFNGGALTAGATTARLEERMDEIRDSLIAECARWGYQSPTSWENAAASIESGHFVSRPASLFNDLRNRGRYPSFDPPLLNPYGGLVESGYTITFPAASGTVYITTDGSDPRLPGGGVNSNATAYSATGSEEVLSAQGAVWKYLDTGVDPGASWTDPGFNDGAWGSGPAELGYGDGNEATTVGFGPNASDKYRTTWFRRSFNVTDASAYNQLRVRLRRDDGARVYLNGEMIVNDNLPAGPITSATFASSVVGGGSESTYYETVVSPDDLVDGANILAVEVHQANATSSDISFDLELLGLVAGEGLVITEDTRIRARVLIGGEWSALADATFLMQNRVAADETNLLITEVHYNPAGSDDFEFVEVWNASTNLVDLTGVALSNAVSFVFPDGLGLRPGEFAVVVEDSASFETRYQEPASPYFYDPLRVAGQWSGRLNNSGEAVVLVQSNGTVIATADYKIDGDWPERADGDGSSLEVRAADTVPASQPGRDTLLADGRVWRSSPLYHGSPGRFDAVSFPVVINEVLSHTDATEDYIELLNTSGQSVDLSGWYLGDHKNDPLRFQIGAATFLPGGGFARWTRTDLGFGFSELGSDAWLTIADGSNVVRMVDTVDFGAAAREEPFGLHYRSDGETDFTELLAATPNAANTMPRVGPVVMGELMHSPRAGLPEYIELVNITDQVVPLYDPLVVTNTWRLRGGVDFVFPQGVMLLPCEPLLVCSTNPVAFRAAYGLPASVPVYGPWEGALNRSGETQRLERPLDPEPDGFVPYGRVDRVAWRDYAPWPVSGVASGLAMERAPHRAYGNDPAHWWLTGVDGTPGVVSENRMPLVSLAGPGSVAWGTAGQWTIDATDPDAPWQEVTVEVLELPGGATYHAGNQVVDWNVAQGPGARVETIRLRVTDNAACDPQSVTQVVAIAVFDPAQGAPLPVQQKHNTSGGVMQVSFPVLAGQTYRIEVTDSLLPPNWQEWETAVPVSNGVVLRDLPLSGNGARRYYRIRWMPE